ncbi:MAG: DUF5666 domain-containing protein [Cyclonatronaceae bacterium]
MTSPAKYLVLFLLLSAVLFWSCEIDRFDRDRTPLTEDEAMLTGQIVGESVSENRGGILSVFPEAFAIPTESGLLQGPSLLSVGSFHNLLDYTYEFDPASGEHSVAFSTMQEDELLQSSAAHTLIYRFLDRNGDTLVHPDQQQQHIETVFFQASRSGNIQTDTRTSFYTRTDQLFIDGLSSASDVLTLDGFHSGEGTIRLHPPQETPIEREYRLDINYLDIRIQKSVVQNNRNFRSGVNGALSYESTVRQIHNGAPESKIVNGTLELNGDGTALLKFREQFDTFRLRMGDGDVFDEDEFEGRVVRADLADQIFTIANGQRIQVTDETEIEEDEFQTLQEVALAIEKGARVMAEGDYYQPDEDVNLWIATEVEFELESNEFEDMVASVSLSRNAFTLRNGDEFFLTEQSEVEFDDDLPSYENVADAVASGMPVEAEGEFYIDIETGRRLVKEVEFEFEFDEFEGAVVAVDLAEETFTIDDGQVIKITEQTEIDDDGDYPSLEEVAAAMDQGEELEAEGKGYLDASTGYFIAVIVEFED